VRGACARARRRGDGGARFTLTRNAAAFAMMCPTLLLRLMKKAARLEKTES